MVKSKKESVAKVEAPLVSTTKASKKSKRDAEVDLDIKKNPKKQKKAEKKAPPPKKIETSGSSSDSEEEVKKTKKVIAKKPLSKKDGSSSEDSSEDEEPAPVKKQPEIPKKTKAESSSSEDESSSSDEEPVPAKKQPAAVKKAKEESSSSEDDESSSDEDSAPAKKQPTTTLKAAKAESSSSSEDESSSDEESAPAKKQPTAVKSVKPAAKDSSSSEDESDEDSDEESEDEKKKEPSTEKLPAATKSKSDSESSEEDSDDEESDDEKPPTKKAKVSPPKTSKQESSSDESSEEESEDEKVTPKKKDTDVEMVEAEQKSLAKEPKTPTTQTPTPQARGGSTTLFAGNLPFQLESADVENFFKEVGDIVDVRLASDPDGRSKGYGHVEFASPEAAQKALKLMNGKPLLGRDIRLSEANAKPAPRSSNADGGFQSNNRKGEGSQVKTIYVTRFDKSVSERDMRGALREHFSGCGQITRISLPCDRETGATRGMAYLDLKEEDGFNKALELNGSELGGWNIQVLEGRPRGQNADGNNGRDRFSGPRPGRAFPGRAFPGRCPPGRAPPGRDRRAPSKPSVLASAKGTKTVFDD
ncbi:Nucleolin 2 [Raphanus sativus]|uniref:Nucleolin 2 isoform X1 n=1 Tax=Raphanus sativus TaxID=3726 RepID=A0A6J0NRD7_RAPSA|nr:nucleolin 2 isoform X1 [Raphanus sativus]XP_056842291.1 nucleolin 2 isoform X1 [Raphanus sativus]KAJ4893959.1 Nucleolin 2 [Raphanus sativus]